MSRLAIFSQNQAMDRFSGAFVAEDNQTASAGPPGAPASESHKFAVLAPTSPAVDIVTFRAYLSEKCPNYKCSICQHATPVGIMQFFDGNVPSLLTTFVVNPHPQLGTNVYTSLGIICQNCSHIDFFYAATIEAWARARAEAGGAG